MAKESYPEADAAYREALTKSPGTEDLRLGLVRALIGENKVHDAQAEAAALLNDHPQSAVSEVAISEAAFRAADFDTAFLHAKAAIQKDACEGRARAALANLYEVNALFASSAQHYGAAHRLRPDDELIRRSWIDTLPRKERQVELAKYLEGEHHLSEEDARAADTELQHLKARRSGECRVTSKKETAATPLKPIYGDNQHPVAYGLDVLFDGKRRRMQIDTGASGIVLADSAARGLNLESEYEIKASGIGDEGARKSYLSHVKSIQIGEIEVSNCMVEVVAKSKLDVDGLIGMDVFRKWLVTLDYQDAQLRLAPLPPRPGKDKLESDPLASDIGDESDVPQDRFMAPEMKDWAAVVRIGHQILLPARLKKDSPGHFVIMDTGASSTLLSADFGKETGKLYGSDVEITGISGKVKKVFQTRSTSLIVDRFMLPPEPYLATDLTSLSHNTGTEVSGLFGLPTLQRLTIQIDYRDNLLKLSYDPKRDIIHF